MTHARAVPVVAPAAAVPRCFHVQALRDQNKFKKLSATRPSSRLACALARTCRRTWSPTRSLHRVGEPILLRPGGQRDARGGQAARRLGLWRAELKVWRVQLRDRARDQWFNAQDLFVEEDRAETLFTKESYVQVWERRKSD